MLRLGIVGLPNVGKSTRFNTLTASTAATAESYPFFAPWSRTSAWWKFPTHGSSGSTRSSNRRDMLLFRFNV
jgi:ribosome biogenesis GTPase A